MKNETAISYLKGLLGNGYPKQEKAIQKAIKALEKIESGDLISRKSASEAILKMTNRPSVKENPNIVNGLMGAYNIINGISHIKMK